MSQLPIDTSPFFMQRLEQVVDSLIENAQYEVFRLPVDWKALSIPDYPRIIQYPMDLTTIKNKLQTSKYKTIQEVFFDLEAIWSACIKYNGRESQIGHLADSLREQYQNEINDIYNEYYQQHRNKSENLKATLKAILLKTTKTQMSILLPWFESMNVIKQTESDEFLIDLALIKPRSFDELIRYFGLSW